MIGLLTDADLCLIIDALNGMWIDQAHPTWDLKPLVRLLVEDAIRLHGLNHKWQVDADLLLAKVEDFRGDQVCRVIDVASRFWKAVGRGESASPARKLIARLVERPEV